MRRIASGCMSEYHPFYGVLMGRLSEAMFEWDKTDHEQVLSFDILVHLVVPLQ